MGKSQQVKQAIDRYGRVFLCEYSHFMNSAFRSQQSPSTALVKTETPAPPMTAAPVAIPTYKVKNEFHRNNSDQEEEEGGGDYSDIALQDQ